MSSAWNMTAKKSGNDGEKREKPPVGNHLAILVGVFDMGHQQDDFNPDDVKWQHRAFFVWELTGEQIAGTTKNHVIGIDLTLSLHEKAKLRKWLEARTGKPIADGASLDVTSELGQACFLNVVEKKGYPKVEGVAALTKNVTVPAPTYKPTAVSLDEFRAGGWLPEWCPWLYGNELADHIRASREMGGSKPVPKKGENMSASQPDSRASSEYPNSPTIQGRPTSTNTLPGTPPPLDDDDMTTPEPDPAARWDYHDGSNWIKNVPTAGVQQFLTDHKIDSATLYVKPAGTKDQKRAHEYGFASAAPVGF